MDVKHLKNLENGSMQRQRTIVLDIETNGLTPDKCWVVVCRDVDTDEVATFRHIHERTNAEGFKRFISGCTTIIGHNVLSFDVPVLEQFGCPLSKNTNVIDTLVISRLLNYKQEGGHSLEAWGARLGFAKSTFDDFTQWSKQLEDRCIQDTLLTKALYNTFSKYLKEPKWIKPIELEHKVSYLCNTLNTNGFSFNIQKAKELKEELSTKVNLLKEEFTRIFPPKAELIKEITPVSTKSGSLNSKDFRWLESKDLTAYTEGASFSLFTFSPFNPSSPKQVVERLNQAGWKPTEKTKGHIAAVRSGNKDELTKFKEYGWKISEENLATLPETAPEGARKLAEYLLLNSRLGDLEEWEALYRPNSGRIHGTFNPIGSWTHRKSHNSPNMANIPSLTNRHGKPQPYGKEFRSLFQAEEGRVLVGCDAEGIQLRLFAHYCNDPKLIEAIANGKKEDKTDIHSLNKEVLGTICNSREVAKTYIYALLLGAGTAKQAEILSCKARQAQEGLERILKFYPGWKELKEGRLRKDAEKGQFEGLDGRMVIFPSAHYILAGYLQNGESVVMKMASLLWNEVLQKNKVNYKFVNDVHDEWQTETLPRYADFVGQVQAESIVSVGRQLELNCPLAGKYVIGNNWAETH